MDEREHYDAFLSYSSADRRKVGRIQNFLQAYRYGEPKRRVAVFRDYSDMSAGVLSERIEAALAASRHLVIASSPRAAESRWVDEEIKSFDRLHGDPSRVCVAVLEGDPTREIIPALRDREYLRHDLTRGWFLGIPKIRTRIEMLRILSTLTGRPLRELAKWHIWRSLRNWGLTLAAALLPFVVYFLVPVYSWQPLVIDDPPARYPVFAEAEGDRVKGISRYRGRGPQGFRNYFYYSPDLLSAAGRSRIETTFDLKTRLLPERLMDARALERVPPMRVSEDTLPDRETAGSPFIGNPGEGRFVVVYEALLTEEERAMAWDDAVDTGQPVPRTRGVVVMARHGDSQVERYLEDLYFFWQPQDDRGNPTPPSMAISVLWDGELGLWLGIPAWDQHKAGGLWHSPDAGHRWHRIEGFRSVNSLGIRREGEQRGIVVTERHVEYWRGVTLVPYPSRAALSFDRGETWDTADMPAFGSRSEIQHAGTLAGGEEVVRVDETVYRRVRLPRWESLLQSDR